MSFIEDFRTRWERNERLLGQNQRSVMPSPSLHDYATRNRGLLCRELVIRLAGVLREDEAAELIEAATLVRQSDPEFAGLIAAADALCQEGMEQRREGPASTDV